MKALITFTNLLFLGLAATSSASAKSDCYGTLLDNYSKDSNSFQIYSEEVAEDFDSRGREVSAQALNILEKNLDCKPGSLKASKTSCREIVPGNLSSKVCYAEVENGYFLISIDMMEKVNLIFSRWD